MPSIFARPLRAAALAVAMMAFIGTAAAQTSPTPAAIALAKEVLVLKGASQMWDPVIPGVIERVKATFLQGNVFAQGNAAFAKDLGEVAALLRTEYATKSADLTLEVARTYAERFSEPELKELVAFYKTPLGKKVIAEEPKVIDASGTRIQQWADRFSETVIARMRIEMKKKGHEL